MLSQGMKNIIKAMKKHNVEVVSVCLSGMFIFHTPIIFVYFQVTFHIFTEFLFYKPEKVPSLFRDVTEDHQRMFDVLKASQLKWIAILPPHISGIFFFRMNILVYNNITK